MKSKKKKRKIFVPQNNKQLKFQRRNQLKTFLFYSFHLTKKKTIKSNHELMTKQTDVRQFQFM